MIKKLQKCSVDGCQQAHYAKGLCKGHYRQQWQIDKRDHRARYTKQYYERDDVIEREKSRFNDKYRKVKNLLVEEKLKRGGCKICGITDPRVLEFHHRDPRSKLFTISQSSSRNIKTILKEINKCDILCSNCHTIVTLNTRFPNHSNKVSWDKIFLNIAKTMALRSTCPRLSTGAVIVTEDQRILSTGFNGAPNNADECNDHGCILVENHCTRAVHAEVNAILYAARRGIAIDCSRMYSLYNPCIHCSLAIIQSGIIEVVFADYYGNTNGIERLEELGVVVRKYSDIETDKKVHESP